jgi:DNA-binding XRE family transcriptional regulator
LEVQVRSHKQRAAKVIHQKRLELELTQVEVAERVRNRGVVSLSEPHLRRIEKGLALPTVIIAMEIAAVLDTDVYAIWG